MKFHGDILPIKISANEESISHTIEELLELNKRIPARTNKEIMMTTEKQMDKSDYKHKDRRGEQEAITEAQMAEKQKENEAEDVVEIRLEEAKPSDGGHKPEAWDTSEKIRNHVQVPKIWFEVYKNEDERKKLDKGQLDKKIKK